MEGLPRRLLRIIHNFIQGLLYINSPCYIPGLVFNCPPEMGTTCSLGIMRTNLRRLGASLKWEAQFREIGGLPKIGGPFKEIGASLKLKAQFREIRDLPKIGDPI